MTLNQSTEQKAAMTSPTDPPQGRDTNVTPTDVKQPESWQEKFESLQREYEEFAYVVSHDLAAPLRQISGFTDILLNEIGDKMNEQQAMYKDMILHAAKEAGLSLDALLEFSRLNTDEKTVETVETEKLFADILQKLSPIITARKANIKVGALPQSMRGDKKILTLALYHLLHNALKFHAPGNRPVIEVSAAEDDTFQTFTIRDNGTGIKPERHEQVFIILRKAHSAEDYKGRGVGLTFARKIARQHGGDVTLESEVGKGTTIHFTIRKDIEHLTASQKPQSTGNKG